MSPTDCEFSKLGEGDLALGESLGETLTKFASVEGGLESIHAALGEFFHELRNRLNSLALSIYLGERSFPTPANQRFAELNQITSNLIRYVEHFQSVCRPMRLTRVSLLLCSFLRERFECWSSLWRERGGELRLTMITTPLPWEYDLNRWSQALDDFIAWRSRVSKSRQAELSCRREDQRITLTWCERGRAEELKTPSHEGDQLDLSLPFLLRVAHAHGGRWTITRDPEFRLELSFTQATEASVEATP